MTIAPDALEEFARLYEKEFGEKISLDQAREMASRLMHLYVKLADPLPDERSKPRQASGADEISKAVGEI